MDVIYIYQPSEWRTEQLQYIAKPVIEEFDKPIVRSRTSGGLNATLTSGTHTPRTYNEWCNDIVEVGIRQRKCCDSVSP